MRMSPSIRRLTTLVTSAIITCGALLAQSAPCLVAYENMLGVYAQDGKLAQVRTGLDTLCVQCADDKEHWHQLLLLSAVTHQRLDSLEAMTRDLETLQRHHRNIELKPYDDLIKNHREVWNTFQYRIRPGFRKDHGRFRAGIMGGLVLPSLSLDGSRKVFEADEPFRHKGLAGGEVGILVEHDVAHNLAVRLSVAMNRQGFRVRNNAIHYEEKLTSAPIELGLKKMFWLGETSPWVPYVAAGGTYARIAEASASIERSGDGVRFLAPKSLERVGERERDQLLGWGAVGVSYKVGHTVLFSEGRYNHAFTALIPDEPKYSNTELLARYYYVDTPLRISHVAIRAGLMYVVKYHRKNRLST